MHQVKCAPPKGLRLLGLLLKLFLDSGDSET